jgi:hypothetical protein
MTDCETGGLITCSRVRSCTCQQSGTRTCAQRLGGAARARRHKRTFASAEAQQRRGCRGNLHPYDTCECERECTSATSGAEELMQGSNLFSRK